MSESASSIAIDGEAATKALESLRKFAEAPRKGKTAVEKASGDAIRLVFGLKDKEEYKSGEKVMINLKYALESADDEYRSYSSRKAMHPSYEINSTRFAT